MRDAALLDDARGKLTKDGIRIHEAADFKGMHVAGKPSR